MADTSNWQLLTADEFKKQMEEDGSSVQELLDELPDDARVGVKDEFGNEKWRKKDEIRDTDEVRFKVNGNLMMMTGKPGPPVEDPLQPADKKIAEMLHRKKEHLRSDPLRRALGDKQTGDTKDPLLFILEAIAEETSSLQFDRQQAERNGDIKTSSQLAMRRINGLKALGDTWLKRAEQISAAGVDLDSPAFVRVMELTLDTLFECMQKRGIAADTVQALAADIESAITSEHWRAKAEKRVTEG